MDNQDVNVKLKFFGIPKLIPYVKKYWKIMLPMVLMGAFSSVVDAIYPLFNRYAINHFIGEGTLDTLRIFIIAYVVLMLIQAFMNYYSTYLAGKVEMYVNHDLREASFNHLQTLSFAYFNQNNVGYIHARVMSDTGKIGGLVSWSLMEIIWHGTYIIAVMVMMLSINVRLALYVFILVPIAVVLISIFQKKLVKCHREIREINSQITSDYNEAITGAKSIKTLVIEKLIQDGFEEDTQKMKVTSVHSTRYSAGLSAIITTMGSLALAIVLWQGGTLTLEGLMEIGTLSVFMNYAIYLIEPLQWIIDTFANLIAVQVNIERFTRLMETESDVVDSEEVIEKYGDTFNPKKENCPFSLGKIINF